jgi:flavodoxin
MKGLVVFHTRFGNCRRIAESIARGLTGGGLEVEISDAAARRVGSEFDFVAVGSPTRMGNMTGPIRRFIKREIKGDVWEGKPFLAFGTGGRPKDDGSKHDEWNCAGAVRIHETLEEKKLEPLREPARFFIKEETIKGPLENGEEERAFEVGREIAAKLCGPGA